MSKIFKKATYMYAHFAELILRFVHHLKTNRRKNNTHAD